MSDGKNSITDLTKSVFPESNMVEGKGIADVFSHYPLSLQRFCETVTDTPLGQDYHDLIQRALLDRPHQLRSSPQTISDFKVWAHLTTQHRSLRDS